MTEKKPYDLEDRLIRFSIRMLTIADLVVKTRAGNHIERNQSLFENYHIKTYDRKPAATQSRHAGM